MYEPKLLHPLKRNNDCCYEAARYFSLSDVGRIMQENEKCQPLITAIGFILATLRANPAACTTLITSSMSL